jgi:hypothetical protein
LSGTSKKEQLISSPLSLEQTKLGYSDL